MTRVRAAGGKGHLLKVKSLENAHATSATSLPCTETSNKTLKKDLKMHRNRQECLNLHKFVAKDVCPLLGAPSPARGM